MVSLYAGAADIVSPDNMNFLWLSLNDGWHWPLDMLAFHHVEGKQADDGEHIGQDLAFTPKRVRFGDDQHEDDQDW